jgi:hypothetical protein
MRREMPQVVPGGEFGQSGIGRFRLWMAECAQCGDKPTGQSAPMSHLPTAHRPAGLASPLIRILAPRGGGAFRVPKNAILTSIPFYLPD